jgi:superfamily II DNA/RNA helicase
MYNSRVRSQDRPNRSGGSSRPFNSRRPVRSFNRRGPKASTIHESKFIRKATIASAVIEYVPQNAFKDFAIDEQLKNNIIERGYTKPTAIQDKIIPEALLHKDVVGIANTGTGKTAAFLIPLIQKVIHERTQKIIILTHYI